MEKITYLTQTGSKIKILIKNDFFNHFAKL
jgi:hypothetical protein